MAGNLITSLLSLATNLLPSIAASARAPSSSSNPNNNLEKGSASAVEEALESLMRTLKWIKATMYDAGEREIIDSSVKFWLKELKKVAYDAEIVLSEYRYEVTRVQVQARKDSEASGSHKRKQIEYIVQIPDGILDRLNKIRSRFDEIAKDRDALQLKESDGVRRPNNKILRPPTGYMVDEASIFGRDAEISKVIDFLLSENEKLFSVISIVGKGGLGKTTIAQLVYKDRRVSQCFNIFGWVCVSEEFDIRILIKATIESFTKTKYGLTDQLSQLQEELAKIVKGKTILLVLDDVWNEKEKFWELFRVPFKKARMVKILVTTRNKNVAKVMQTTNHFIPTNLSEYSCWQLFQHYAFSGTSYTMPIHLVDIGREIARKCGGLPLAVKSIACLLRQEANENFWRDILQSDLWEKEESKVIFETLQISYDHLPTHLKPCFLFCSMFPKDYVFSKMELIELWIAHGYIESRSNRKIIEIGVEYFNELKERSFIDDATVWFASSSEFGKLHDIIHDFARNNSENEYYTVEINQPLDIQKKTVPPEAYHLYVRGSMGYVNHIPEQTMKVIRTICIDIREFNGDFEYGYCTNCTKAIDLDLEVTKDCQDCFGDVTSCNLSKFQVLKVLMLHWDCMTKVPHSISELKHLTYLSIHSNHLKILPISIGLLYNLLSLELHCESLEYLPENIGDLANLQFLSIQEADYLKELPKSFCSLANLLTLYISPTYLDYVPHGLVNFPSIRKFSAWLNVRTIGWLKDMKDLEGRIVLSGLKKFRNLEDAKRANLRNKCKLEILELQWDDQFEFEFEGNSELLLHLIPETSEGEIVGADDVLFSLLECFQPHPNLKELRLGGYPSAIVPGFLLQSIRELVLERCGHIQSLPFSNLHTLKDLNIYECSIRALQLEQLPSQLETLYIYGCDHLELITGLGHMDKLAELTIKFCKTLKLLTMDDLRSVESTELFGDSSHEKPHKGRQSISSLTRLSIVNCGLLCVLPDGLIPSWPCIVGIKGCGFHDIFIGYLYYDRYGKKVEKEGLKRRPSYYPKVPQRESEMD